jgi:hypothetical protein
VSTDAFHRAHRACFGAMITTARHMRDLRPDDVEIGDLGAAGLARPCVIRVARLATFEWSDQVRRVGTLHRRERQAIATLLQCWCGTRRCWRGGAPQGPVDATARESA